MTPKTAAAATAPSVSETLAPVVSALTTQGYAHLRAIYDREEMARALELTTQVSARTEGVSQNVPRLNRDQQMVYNLQNKDPDFLRLLFEPAIVQQILIHFLNDPWYKPIPQDQPNYILRSFLARSSRSALPLHIDSFVPYGGAHVFIMQVMIVLEDMDQSNGSTLIVPGSHLAGAYAKQQDLECAVPQEAKAGDVLIWDSRLWHGAAANPSQRSRWALIATFCRWWLKQAFDIPRALPERIKEQLTDSQRAILGFCSQPYLDECEGIDMKRGYEGLE